LRILEADDMAAEMMAHTHSARVLVRSGIVDFCERVFWSDENADAAGNCADPNDTTVVSDGEGGELEVPKDAYVIGKLTG
jgi:hypothetical protein